MNRPTLLFSLLLLIATAWAQEEIGSHISRFDDDREEFLLGRTTLRLADLGTFTYDKGIFVQEAKIRPGERKGYKAKFTSDVTEAIVGVEFRNYKFEANAILEVNMNKRINPFLRGSVNTDTQCRAQKYDGGPESVFCSFDTSSRGDGTLYIWVTGRRFTTYNINYFEWNN